jgi:hypothetical protein
MLPFRRRRRVRSDGFLLFVVLVGLIAFLSREASYAEKEKGKGGKKHKEQAAAGATDATGQPNLTNIPLPVGHEAKGLVLPDFNAEGKLVGRFEAGLARRLDEQRVAFRDLKITTFTPENQVDLQVEMHTSIFNLSSRILTSEERSTVRRADFNIVGDSAQFDTNARTGKLAGNVKMVINGQSNLLKRANP